VECNQVRSIFQLEIMMNSTTRLFGLALLILSFGGILAGCSGRQAMLSRASIPTFFSDEIKKEIKGVTKTVVSINSNIKYEIQKFHYERVNGRFVPDPRSHLRYKLANNGVNGTTVETEDKTLSGGGLILNFEPVASRYIILTSNHLVAPQDTTDIYYLDEYGQNTDVLFARYIVKNVDILVRGDSNWRAEAKLIISEEIEDLAIIESQTNNLLGVEFHNRVGFDLDLGWGDWVFLFGFPKGVKQISGGWVSESPYPSTLTVDAVVRFGFSGGPVFALAGDPAKLDFVGVIKSVPRSTLDFIAPAVAWPMGYGLAPEDISDLVVKKEIMVEYGTAYFVSPKTLQRFFNTNRNAIERAGVRLPPKYYGEKEPARLPGQN
ncbi:MAG TPA: serine protease, partial [bacterium]